MDLTIEQTEHMFSLNKRQTELDAARYRWLRDRMKVHYESPVCGGEKRATLTMRVGHGFLDSKIHPTTGWTDQKYFDECREKVDAAIDSAMLVTPNLNSPTPPVG